jgi:hypothetical protein
MSYDAGVNTKMVYMHLFNVQGCQKLDNTYFTSNGLSARGYTELDKGRTGCCGIRELKLTNLRPIHTCHTAPLPCFDSAVSFVKVRVVAGNIRTASPTV